VGREKQRKVAVHSRREKSPGMYHLFCRTPPARTRVSASLRSGHGLLLDFLLPFPRQRNTTAEHHQTRSLPSGRGAGSAAHTHIRLFLTLSSSTPPQSASTLAGPTSAIIVLFTNESSRDASPVSLAPPLVSALASEPRADLPYPCDIRRVVQDIEPIR
jgi:hypothetical protein